MDTNKQQIPINNIVDSDSEENDLFEDYSNNNTNSDPTIVCIKDVFWPTLLPPTTLITTTKSRHVVNTNDIDDDSCSNVDDNQSECSSWEVMSDVSSFTATTTTNTTDQWEVMSAQSLMSIHNSYADIVDSQLQHAVFTPVSVSL